MMTIIYLYFEITFRLFSMGKYGFSVWMGGLPERVRTRDIEDFFKGFGKIIDISMKTKYGKLFINVKL